MGPGLPGGGLIDDQTDELGPDELEAGDEQDKDEDQQELRPVDEQQGDEPLKYGPNVSARLFGWHDKPQRLNCGRMPRAARENFEEAGKDNLIAKKGVRLRDRTGRAGEDSSRK